MMGFQSCSLSRARLPSTRSSKPSLSSVWKSTAPRLSSENSLAGGGLTLSSASSMDCLWRLLRRPITTPFEGFKTQRPNLVEKPVLDHPTTAMWFDTAAFQPAPQFTIGTSSRNPVRAPGARDLDLALVKRTRLTESVNMEFRSEFFNFTNMPPLGAPAVVLGDTRFGTIISAEDPRVLQFAMTVTF